MKAVHLAILGFFVSGIFFVVLAIYQFINLVFGICGIFMAFQLMMVSDKLLATYSRFMPIQSESASVALGLLFSLLAISCLVGLGHAALLGSAMIAVILSLIGLLFGMEAVAFLVGALVVFLMPFLFKNLAFPLILWKDEGDHWLECMAKTLLLAIISAPAFITVMVELVVFVDGGRAQAEGFTSYILAPILYVTLFFAQLKRNRLV
ncbi:hypothetical protein [Massilia yuzhufengensis]|uniref:hypothetical protein n=1 Tax=Massilia yuzhufengensis TaxID=1164594 RepID=UPI0015A5B059|nr:hypothetical protein [Massilia yuzhufengensis]